jgi:hypothetical protein
MPAPRRNVQYTAYRGRAMPAASTRARRQRLSCSTTVVTKKAIGSRFMQHFRDWHPADLAHGAEVTKEAARLWLNGERTIDLASALKLARSTPEGKFWLLTEMGEFESSQLIHNLLKALKL